MGNLELKPGVLELLQTLKRLDSLRIENITPKSNPVPKFRDDLLRQRTK
jgi:hypothetical protein